MLQVLTEMQHQIWCKVMQIMTYLANLLVEQEGAFVRCYQQEAWYSKHLAYWRDCSDRLYVVELKPKLASHVSFCIFIGYTDSHSEKVWRFINLHTMRKVRSRDVQWVGQMWAVYI